MNKFYEKGNSDWYSDVFKKFENGLNGQLKTEFHQIRKQAMKNFRKTGFPTTKHEEWKYTNVSPLLKHDFEISKPVNADEISDYDIGMFSFNDMKYPQLVFLNGYFLPDLYNCLRVSPDE